MPAPGVDFDPLEQLLAVHRAGEVARRIHANDAMWWSARRLARGSERRARYLYFRTGLEIARAQLQVVGPSLRADSRVLDFASGYGRVTRFLLRRVPAERLWVSDVDVGAVEFQRSTFGVHGARSSFDPEALELAERFDVILVTSLFTHLPKKSLEPWLARLCGLLAPEGRLVFSTLDPKLKLDANAFERESLERDGLIFDRSSASRSWSCEEGISTSAAG